MCIHVCIYVYGEGVHECVYLSAQIGRGGDEGKKGELRKKKKSRIAQGREELRYLVT